MTARADGAITVAQVLRPPRAFDAACRMVLDYLGTVAPLGLWAVTRVVDGRWIVLDADDTGFGFAAPGVTAPWEDTLCRRMVEGTMPRITPDTAAVPALADVVTAAAEGSLSLTGYIGTPIVRPNGELFGTVCGLSTAPLPEDLAVTEGLLDLLSGLLSSVLEADTEATDAARQLERAVSDAETDALTGLLNRRGWERWIAREEDRFRRFGDPASVLMLDLDRLKEVNDTGGHAAGDRYIRATADTLRQSLRVDDALARLGGDEFAMVVRAGPADAERLVARLETALEEAGVLGSLGYAPYSVVTGFPGACAAADAAMYANKRARRSARV